MSAQQYYNSNLSALDRVRTRWAALDPAWRWALMLFAGYRILLSVWMALVSAAFPRTYVELAIPAWPITAPFGSWLERVLLWPNARYDVFWTVGIAHYGYTYREGSTAFHPLNPLLVGMLGRVLGEHYLLAAWLVAQVCCVFMLVLLYKLVLLDYDAGVARRTNLFLLASPLGFAFLIPYAESLLLLCIVGAFYAARRGRWLLAGVAGAGAALTKQPGVLVVLPLMWELWRVHGVELRAFRIRQLWRQFAGIALVPLGMLVYLVYRATLGDATFSWRDPSSFLWALLVSPSYDRVWDHHFSWPWVGFLAAVDQLSTKPYVYLILNTFGMLIMAAIICYAALRQRGSYALYSLCLLAMNLSIVYPELPYISILRRCTIIFPLFIQLAVWGRLRRFAWPMMIIMALLSLYTTTAFVRNAYLP